MQICIHKEQTDTNICNTTQSSNSINAEGNIMNEDDLTMAITNGKQNIINDIGLTIAKTNNLQFSLDNLDVRISQNDML